MTHKLNRCDYFVSLKLKVVQQEVDTPDCRIVSNRILWGIGGSGDKLAVGSCSCCCHGVRVPVLRMNSCQRLRGWGCDRQTSASTEYLWSPADSAGLVAEMDGVEVCRSRAANWSHQAVVEVARTSARQELGVVDVLDNNGRKGIAKHHVLL